MAPPEFMALSTSGSELKNGFAEVNMGCPGMDTNFPLLIVDAPGLTGPSEYCRSLYVPLGMKNRFVDVDRVELTIPQGCYLSLVAG